MRQQLEGDETPVDASVEAVLPGIHTRMDIQRKQISDLQELVVKKCDHLENVVESSQQTMLSTIGKSVAAVGNNILNQVDTPNTNPNLATRTQQSSGSTGSQSAGSTFENSPYAHTYGSFSFQH